MVSTQARLAVGAVVAAVVAFMFAGVGIFINSVSDPVCLFSPTTGDSDLLQGQLTDIYAPQNVTICREIDLKWKVPLIGTHLLSFALMPFAMYTFWSRAPALEQKGAAAPFASVLGFGFLMVSICGEIGWHVSQHWFYTEEYYVLNYVFYVFFLLGTGLWTIGVKPKAKARSLAKTGTTISLDVVDLILLISPILGTVVYALSSAIKNGDFCQVILHDPAWCNPSLASKVPIYLLMAFQIITLTLRLRELLDNDPLIWLFPFFSVIRNLMFIALLSIFENSSTLNPIFHTLHDLLGTLMGVFIATALVYIKIPKEPNTNRKLK